MIAEVKSRFDPNTGGADPKRFTKAVCELGFSSEYKVSAYVPPISYVDYSCTYANRYSYVQDFSNKMFILLYFMKKVSNFVVKVFGLVRLVFFYNIHILHPLLCRMSTL